MSGYRGKLRLIEIPREDFATETGWFDFNENEEIIDVQWFPEFVSLTLAEVNWSKYANEEGECDGPGCCD